LLSDQSIAKRIGFNFSSVVFDGESVGKYAELTFWQWFHMRNIAFAAMDETAAALNIDLVDSKIFRPIAL
jgi:hypothetical protein